MLFVTTRISSVSFGDTKVTVTTQKIHRPGRIVKPQFRLCLLRSPSTTFYKDLRTLSSDASAATMCRHLLLEDME